MLSVSWCCELIVLKWRMVGRAPFCSHWSCGHLASSHPADLDSHKVGALWGEVVGSASCVPCPGKSGSSLASLIWEGQSWEVGAGWADTAQGWTGHSTWLPHLLWSFFISMLSLLALRCTRMSYFLAPARKWVLLLLYPLEFSLFKPNVDSSQLFWSPCSLETGLFPSL